MKTVPIPDVHLERIGLSSSAREVGDTIFLAGHTAIDNNGAVVFPGDPVAQCRYTLEALERTLKTLASSLRDLVKITVYVTDVRYRQELHEVRKTFFAPPYPVSTLVEVSQLVFPGLTVEIDGIAIRGAGGDR